MFDGPAPSRQPDDFETNRADLFRHEQAFAACVEWLAAQRRRKTINRRRTSYGLKHEVERAYTVYVPDGILIAAAIHLGIKYARCKNDTSIHLAISG